MMDDTKKEELPLYNNTKRRKLTWTEYIIINYRWVLVVFLLLPISLLYDFFYYTRAKLIFYMNSAPLQHDRKVEKIQQQVTNWGKEGKKNFMCTSRPGWQTMSFREPLYKRTFNKIDINLVDILKIDKTNKIVRCEPLVTMGQLTKFLLKEGWTIPVVPELDDLTIGGLVMGTGIESSSHKYGLFQHICISYELILSDGSLVTCSKDKDPDLYYSVPWSYGTLGFLTAVDIQIIPAKKYLKIEYNPYSTHEEMINAFILASEDKRNDFVEGLVYSFDKGVIMTANMTDQIDKKKLNQISYWYKPWFFKHVEEILDQNQNHVEYIPLRDYYHRHTRSLFWEMQEIIPFGNNIIFRMLLGWLIPPKVSLLKLTQGKTIKELYEQNHFIQDMLVPVSNMSKAIGVFHKEVEIYPLWLCPYDLPKTPGMLQYPEEVGSLFVDIGVYGTPKVSDFNPVETTRRVEEFVRKSNGFQMMYADSYMTKEEYHQMFNHDLYDKVRKRLNCFEAFPEVYQKVNRKARS